MNISSTLLNLIVPEILISTFGFPEQEDTHGTMLAPPSRVHECRFGGNPEQHPILLVEQPYSLAAHNQDTTGMAFGKETGMDNIVRLLLTANTVVEATQPLKDWTYRDRIGQPRQSPKTHKITW